MNEVQRLNEFMKIAPAFITINQEMINWLTDNGFFNAPASTKHHGAYAGGLYDHSKAVYFALTELTDGLNLKWQRPESPFIIGFFHDLCKIDQYSEVVDDPGKVMFGESSPQGQRVHYEWVDTIIKGHGEKSVMYLAPLMRMTEEEMYCIRFHMGAFKTDEMDSYSKAVQKFPNVLYAHTADMMASQVKGV